MSGRKVNTRTLAVVTRRTRPLVVTARRTLQTSANQQYRFFLGGSDPLPTPTLVRFNEDTWSNSIQKVFSDEEEFTDELSRKASRKADWWAKDAERGTLIDYAMRDDRIGLWARYDPEPPTCPFCTVLISRGAVFHTAETAQQLSAFNTGCTCAVVLISPKDRDRFQESDLVKGAVTEYKDAVKKAESGNITAIVAAMSELRAEKGQTP